MTSPAVFTLKNKQKTKQNHICPKLPAAPGTMLTGPNHCGLAVSAQLKAWRDGFSTDFIISSLLPSVQGQSHFKLSHLPNFMQTVTSIWGWSYSDIQRQCTTGGDSPVYAVKHCEGKDNKMTSLRVLNSNHEKQGKPVENVTFYYLFFLFCHVRKVTVSSSFHAHPVFSGSQWIFGSFSQSAFIFAKTFLPQQTRKLFGIFKFLQLHGNSLM